MTTEQNTSNTPESIYKQTICDSSYDQNLNKPLEIPDPFADSQKIKRANILRGCAIAFLIIGIISGCITFFTRASEDEAIAGIVYALPVIFISIISWATIGVVADISHSLAKKE